MKHVFVLFLLINSFAFAQQETPMFFDKDLGFSTINKYLRLAYSPDGSKVATIYCENKIIIWDVANGKELKRFDGHGNHSVSGMVFSPNGRQLLSYAHYDSSIKIWDSTSGSLIRSINQAGVIDASFNPDGSRIVGRYFGTGLGVGSGIKIWNTANGSEVRAYNGIYSSATYSPDGKQILVNLDEEGIRILDAGNGQTLRTINSNGEEFETAIYSPNGRNIAVNDWNETMRIYNSETGQLLRSIPIKNCKNHVYSPDGKLLLINTGKNWSNEIKIFDTETSRELRSFDNGYEAIAFSPDGRRILAFPVRLQIEKDVYGASSTTLLDATTGKTVGTIGYGPLNVGAKAFSDLQIARFLGNTAEVTKNEAIIKFITDRGSATPAEIETFYRNNVRGLVSEIVDAEFNKISKNLNWSKNNFNQANTVRILNEVIKTPIVNFYLDPTQTNFSRLQRIYRALNDDNINALIDHSERMFSLADSLDSAFGPNSGDHMRKEAQESQPTIDRHFQTQLSVTNANNVSWKLLKEVLWDILYSLNTDIARKVRQ